MQYLGGKFRIAKSLIPYLLKGRKPGQFFVEPFCGGCNMTCQVPGPRIAGDAHPELIQMWRAVRDGWEPPSEVTEQQYKDIKAHKDSYPPELVSFVGFGVSFGGKWFGGYARDNRGYDYALGSKRVVTRQRFTLRGVPFLNKSYQDLYLPPGAIIYCDPPYEDTTRYEGLKFGHADFWRWVKSVSQEHAVYVSEYEAPEGFRDIVQVGTYISLKDKERRKEKRTEKLFVAEGSIADLIHN